MTPGSFVQMWLDDRKIGCGWRCVLVLSIGRKWARLFYPPTCDVITVPKALVASMETAKARPVKLRKTSTRRVIRACVARTGETAASREALRLIR